MNFTKDLKKLSDYLWEIPTSFKKGMLVPARIYASEKILQEVEEKAIIQLTNCASLRGIVKYALAMPDIHSGYGPPIGAVGAMDIDEGVISPCFVGFDENCGVRLLLSEFTFSELSKYIKDLEEEIYQAVPSGLGSAHDIKMGKKELDEILEKGVPGLVEKGFGEKEDVENCESQGRMEWADASCISDLAKRRAQDEVGTLGSGNHFCELQRVVEIFDEEIARVFGVFKDQVVVMIHTGSRALGHQNCTDYWKLAEKTMPKYKLTVPDRELACFPFNSPEGKRFFSALSAASNYAWANRQMISFYVRKAWEKVLGRKTSLVLLYDVAHNICKIEEHIIDGEKKKLIVHRKGATRAFPAGHPEIPLKYKKTGQPVLIPGSMGTNSYLLVGTEKSSEAWYSVSHGAGRKMSRAEAARKTKGEKVISDLKEKGILVKSHSFRGIAEEAPFAYKDIDEVIEVICGAQLARKVAKLAPLGVIKGE